MNQQLTFAPADDGLWEQYDQLATRAYGHSIGDITHLREHADLQVATRGGRVVAGGLGLLVDQFFGGAPVPSACLGDGCVAPEERGDHLATDMTAERLRPLIERGAVISTITTSSTGYARRLGWEAPTGVLAWGVATDDLKRSFASADFEVEHGLTDEAEALQRDLARQWNGPVHRPSWWTRWKQDKSNLTTYRFARPGHPTAGLLSLTTMRHERHGMNLVVHDFWAAGQPAATAMLAFLSRHNTRARTITFRRGALPLTPSSFTDSATTAPPPKPGTPGCSASSISPRPYGSAAGRATSPLPYRWRSRTRLAGGAGGCFRSGPERPRSSPPTSRGR
ncbi:GNAT family N-acetyltransferase [Streptomyces formicae]|uniref:GNAT family N-acetyltransferase n=1 Tax=Streptomyces formicae TaxID=1616117 RepID=UPI001F59733C|nr:GNAT family N-acetyltransferase [Streptomyces formicae]